MSDLFTRFVEKGQVVLVDEAVHHYAMPVYRHQTEVICDVFATDKADALCTSHSDMRQVRRARICTLQGIYYCRLRLR